MKLGHNKGINDSQTPRVAANGKKARFKGCPESFVPVLRWANLAGDHDLPNRLPLPSLPIRTEAERTAKPMTSGITLADLVGALDRLPQEIRAHLHELMNRPEEWAEKPTEMRKRFASRSKETAEFAKQMNFRFAAQFAAVYRRYKLILAARDTLRAIVDDKVPEWPTTAFMKRGTDGFGKYAGDPIADALLEAEIDYIKRCAECRVFFYAGRNNIEFHPPSCAKNVRERERKRKRKEAEQANRKRQQKKGSKR